MSLAGTSLSFPNRYNYANVNRIAASAFSSNKTITTLNIGNNIAFIERNAFYNCTNLTNVNFASDSCLRYIEEKAFSGCGFTQINLPSSIEDIKDRAFRGSKLTSLELPEGLISITGLGAFENSLNLRTLTIPVSLTNIGNQSFAKCTSLTSVLFKSGSKLKTVDKNAFNGCSKLSNISFPSQVTSIGDNAFRACNSLNSVQFSNSIQTIGNYAFYKCSLRSLSLPSSLKTIGNYAFEQQDGAFSSTADLYIPEGVTSIGSHAIPNLPANNIIIASSVTTIGELAFNGSGKNVRVRGKSTRPSGWHENWAGYSSDSARILWNTNW